MNAHPIIGFKKFTAAGALLLIWSALWAQEDEALETVELDQMVVEGYLVNEVMGSSLTAEALIDTSQTVNIISNERIVDESLFELSEVLERVSSVGAADARGLTLRGFSSEDFLRKDGLVGGVAADNTFGTPLSNIERVEVLKGPNAVLYGSGADGGIVNVITKKPLAAPTYHISASFGNHDLMRAVLDLTGPVNESGTLRYRLAAETTQDGLHFVESDKSDTFIAPSLEWTNGKTSALFQTELREANQTPNYWAITAVLEDGKLSERFRDHWFGSNTDYDKNTAETYSLELGHEFENEAKLTFQARDTETSVDYRSLFGWVPDSETGNLDREIYVTKQDHASNAYRLYSVIPIETEGLGNHKLTTGIDYSKDGGKDGFLYAWDAWTAGVTVPPINIYDPDYNLAVGSINYEVGSEWYVEQQRYYIQDTIRFGGQWVVNAGLAYNDFELKDGETVSGDKLTPRLGVVYKPKEGHAVSVNYTTSFKPVDAWQVLEGAPTDPIEGTSYELAYRYESLEKGFSASAAIYHIDKTNIPQGNWTEVVDAVTFDSRWVVEWSSTEQRSKGFELDITGNLRENWSVQFAYGYVDAIITASSNPDEVGTNLESADAHTLSVWSKHIMPQVEGLRLGWGFRHVADQSDGPFGGTALPDYTVFDAAILYRVQNWGVDFALNVKNAFDKLYSSGTTSDNGSVIWGGYGPPRSIILSANWRF